MDWLKERAQDLANRLAPAKNGLGKLTLACGIAMAFLGFPMQIYANWKVHECRIDPVLIAVVLVLYLVRIPYQVSARAWYLLPADLLGLLASCVLTWQYLTY